MSTKQEKIEYCSAELEHLRNELRTSAIKNQHTEVQNSENPETETSEYKDLVTKIKKLSKSWDNNLAQNPSLEYLYALFDSLAGTTDADIVDEFREKTGMRYGTQHAEIDTDESNRPEGWDDYIELRYRSGMERGVIGGK